MNSIYSGQLGEVLLDGGSWHLYRNGVAGRGKSILWPNVEEIYISGSVTSVEFISAGEKRSIKIVDSYKNSIKITLSDFFRMSEAKKQEFTDVYAFILQNVGDRQWTQFLQRLANGERISFKALDISRDGIYCVKGSRKLFGFALGYDRIEIPSVIGCNIRNGIFYIQHLQPNGRLKDRYIDYVQDIPNIHIIQAFIKEISEQNTKE